MSRVYSELCSLSKSCCLRSVRKGVQIAGHREAYLDHPVVLHDDTGWKLWDILSCRGATEHTYTRDHSRPKWHGWHAFRRGLATVLHDLGVDDKTIQAIMRHSSVAVTQQAYIKTLAKQSVDAMKRLEMLIGDTSSAILQ